MTRLAAANFREISEASLHHIFFGNFEAVIVSDQNAEAIPYFLVHPATGEE